MRSAMVLAASVFFIFSSALSVASDELERRPLSCNTEWTQAQPFHVSDAYRQGDKTYENFRAPDNYSKRQSYIPRRSLVKIDPRSELYADAPNVYVPVEIVGTPDTEYQEEKLAKAVRLRSLGAARSGLGRAQTGERGFIHAKALQKASDFTYVVSEDSPILADNGLADMGVVAIRPIVDEEGRFLVQKCCDRSQEAEEPQCRQRHQFELIYADGALEDGPVLGVDLGSCSVLDSLSPFNDENLDAIEGLLNFLTLAKEGMDDFKLNKLETLDARGLARVPLDYENFDGRGAPGPFNSYHYNMDGGGEDAYAHPVAGCVLMKILEEHGKRCREPGCQAQWGNVYNPPSWGEHSSHGDGDCVDFRPLKKSDSLTGLTYRHGDYDREKTLAFIELLKEAGATQIIFNDPQIRKSTRGVSRFKGHDNHIHVCFDVMDEQVVETCRSGIGANVSEE